MTIDTSVLDIKTHRHIAEDVNTNIVITHVDEHFT